MTTREMAQGAAGEIRELIIQSGILPIPLTDLDDLEDKLVDIIESWFA